MIRFSPSPSGKVANRATFRDELTKGDYKLPVFIPYRHFVPLPPKEEANYCLCEAQSDCGNPLE